MNQPESFDDWPAACDAAVERNRPITVRVGNETARVYPSRNIRTLSEGDYAEGQGVNDERGNG